MLKKYDMKLFFTHAACVDSLNNKYLKCFIVGFRGIKIQDNTFSFENVSTIYLASFKIVWGLFCAHY